MFVWGNVIFVLHQPFPMIRSVEKITEYIDTGRRPFRVFADDLSLYVAKGARLNSTDLLVREWLGASAARSFGLNVPPFSPITIMPEHRPDPQMMARIGINWDIPCFASYHVKNAKDISRENAPSIVRFFKGDQTALFQFMKLGIFDMFMAVDDRNDSNMNLLLSRSKAGVSVTLIDQESIFNEGSALHNGLAEQTQEDSILFSTMGCLLLKCMGNADFVILRDQVISEFIEWTSNAQREVDSWLTSCPQEWLNQPDIYRNMLVNDLLEANWVQQVVKQYVEYIELARRS